MNVTKYDTIAFHSDKGIGRVIMSTQAVRSLHEAYPDKRIVVVTPWPDIWVGNPLVSRIYDTRQPNDFYADCIQDRRTWMVSQEPYLHPAYVYKEMHLVDAWCDMLGIKKAGDGPELYLSESELAVTRATKVRSKKPLLMLHVEGGKLPEKDDDVFRQQAQRQLYVRNLPPEAVQKAIDVLQKKYTILLVAAQNQRTYSGTEHLTGKLREVMAFIPMVEKIACIDSFIMHAAAALGKAAAVFWAGTSPRLLGHAVHRNIEPPEGICPTPACGRPNSFFMDVTATGDPWSCPHGIPCVRYTADDILKGLGEKE